MSVTGLTPGKGGGTIAIAGAATGTGVTAAVLPATGSHWLVSAAVAVVAVLVFWGAFYAIKNRTV